MNMQADEVLKVSYCTTVMNRGHYLAQTLPQNLANNEKHPNAEFVILDYGDRKGMPPLDEEGNVLLDTPKENWLAVKDWLIKYYPEKIKSGRIKYARTEQSHFHMAHAKNMAHRLGEGDILVNLDADNAVGKDFTGWLEDKFQENPDIFVRPSVKGQIKYQLTRSKTTDGIAGRIAVSSDMFHKLHGYRESIKSWAGDDTDFQNRVMAENNQQRSNIPIRMYGLILPQTMEEKIENLDEEGKAATHVYISGRMSLNQRIKEALKKELIKEKQPSDSLFGANKDGDFGCGDVAVLQPDFSEEAINFSPEPHPHWVASYDTARGKENTGWSMG